MILVTMIPLLRIGFSVYFKLLPLVYIFVSFLDEQNSCKHSQAQRIIDTDYLLNTLKCILDARVQRPLERDKVKLIKPIAYLCPVHTYALCIPMPCACRDLHANIRMKVYIHSIAQGLRYLPYIPGVNKKQSLGVIYSINILLKLNPFPYQGTILRVLKRLLFCL